MMFVPYDALNVKTLWEMMLMAIWFRANIIPIPKVVKLYVNNIEQIDIRIPFDSPNGIVFPKNPFEKGIISTKDLTNSRTEIYNL